MPPFGPPSRIQIRSTPLLGINLLLTAPISVSLASLSIAKHRIEIGFALSYFVFALIKLASFGICIDKALVYTKGKPISNFASECKDYHGTLIAMIAISALQVLAIIGMAWPLYKRHTNPTSQDFAKVIRWVGTIPVALAVLTLILLERMGSSVNLSGGDFLDSQTGNITSNTQTSNATSSQNDTVTFAQVFAIAGSIGPLIELTKYLFHVQPERLQGQSPFGYVVRITHFTDRMNLKNIPNY
jgi:hypothetical protein